MKILLTGGAGFIGHHLTEKLLLMGYEVVVIDNLTTGMSENISTFKTNLRYQFHFGSACSAALVEPLVKAADVVFNLAASVGVKNIFRNPIECMENNIDIAKNILNLCTKYQKRLFMFSTSEVYGKQDNLPFSEDDDSVFGSYKSLRWGYAASKLIDDFMSRAHYESFGTPITIVRLFNTIGLKQVGHYGMVVPRFFDQALRNQAITVFGNGLQSRCFTDVRSVVASLVDLIPCQDSYGELINVGSSEEITIYDLAVKIKNITASNSVINLINYDEAYGVGFEDIRRRIPCTKKLDQILRERKRFDLEETLGWIYQNTKVQNLTGEPQYPAVDQSKANDLSV